MSNPNVKRLCFITDSFLKDQTSSINGTQVQCYILAKELAKRGYEVHYLTQTKKTITHTPIIEDGIIVHWVPRIDNPLLQFKTYKQYWSILHSINPEFIYNRGRSYLTYIAGKYASQNGVKFIWGSNGENGCGTRKYLPILWKSNKAHWKKLLLTPKYYNEDCAIKTGIALADIVINQTEYQKRELWSNFKKDGLIIKSAYPIPEPCQIQSHPKIVLWLATLSKIKQPELFIELAKKFESNKGWEFWLVGGTSNVNYEKAIRQKSSTCCNLKIFGSVPFEKTASYFQKASIFVSTSQYEGLSNTFVQSWLNGVPVVSLNSDPDNIIQKFQLGIYAKGSLITLQNGLNSIMQDHRKRELYSENAKFYAIKNFDVKKIVDQYEALF